MSQLKKDKPGSTDKEKKPKLVRDSFTIPKNEYEAIDVLKARAMAVGTAAKKSELLRAGLMALTRLDNEQLKAALSAVPTLKTGRPKTEPVTVSTQAPAASQPVTAAPKASARKSPVRKASVAVPMSATGLPTATVRKAPARQAAAAAKKTTAPRARKTATVAVATVA